MPQSPSGSTAPDDGTPDGPALHSLTDAARVLGCGPATVHRALADGRLTAAVVAGRRVVVADARFHAFRPAETGTRAHKARRGL